MTSFEPIDAATVPGWPYVYVVGSYDRRITFFSQQVRGFNLVHALTANDVLKNRTRFAVIGAGAAGLAVASGLSLLIPNAVVDVFEREEHPLHLQRDCGDRNLHPHIYEWPRSVARDERAGLPFLDWGQGPARAVAAEIVRQFGTLQVWQQNVSLHLLHDVTRIEPQGSAYRVHHQSPDGEASALYHAVFLTIGFGRERALDGAPWRSYWSDAGVPQGPRYADHVPRLLVTGGGDGGLIDLCAAVLRDFDHTQLIELVTNWPEIHRLTDELLEIDAQADRAGPGFDYMQAYDENIGPTLQADGLLDVIAERLRNRVQVVFNTEGANFLEPYTSTLNRLLVYLLFRASEHAEHPIQHLGGRVSAIGLPYGQYRVGGGEPFDADDIFVRHGAAKDEAFGAFAAIRDAYKPEHERWLEADPARREPPRLNDDARAALDRAMTTADLPVPRRQLQDALAQQPGRARVGLTGPARVVWGGDVRPETLLEWWSEPQRALRLELLAGPDELDALACALGRFAIHARQVRIESDNPRWTAWLTSLTRRSPHAQAVQAPLTGPLAGAVCAMEEVDGRQLAAELHAAMDAWLLRELDRHLSEYLATGTEPANWVAWRIEPTLRNAMRLRWTEWLERLRRDPSLLARLFRLAACAVEDGHGEQTDRQVLVGPHRLPNLVRTMVLTLAAADAWPVSSPRGDAPGNFERRDAAGRELARIHATGAELIEGEAITARAAQHAWETEIVLLSELNAPAIIEDAAERSFRDIGEGAPRLDAAAGGGKMIVGADGALMAALRRGAEAVSQHLARTEVERQDAWLSQIDQQETQA